MANLLFRRPDIPNLQPVGAMAVTATAPRERPLVRATDGKLPDRLFKYAMIDWHRQAWPAALVPIILIISSVAAARHAVCRGSFGVA